MNIILLGGSPKVKDSTSMYLLDGVNAQIGSDHHVTRLDARKKDVQAFVEAMETADALILAFPLYADGIPAHLLRFFEAAQLALSVAEQPVKVYGIVNAGFYDAKQNHIALAMTKLWAEKCGLVWGGGLGIGGGGMIRVAPLGQGPATDIGKAIIIIAENATTGKRQEDVYAEPNFPRFLYKTAAHIGWRQMARKNGLSRQDMKRQILLNETKQ